MIERTYNDDGFGNLMTNAMARIVAYLPKESKFLPEPLKNRALYREAESMTSNKFMKESKR